MNLSLVNLWWLAAGALVVAELLSGTFYLLMFSLGAVAAAVAAMMGAELSIQLACAALVGGGATAIWHWKRAQKPRSLPAAENRDVNIDIGQQIHIAEWAEDRTARVNYRGAPWTARLSEGSSAHPGTYRICAVEGNWLVVEPARAPS
jgi:membrane protein implicated in regulation of membrane protease activity